MLTKTQFEVMKIFVSKINDRFSISQISKLTRKPYPLIHRSVKLLIANGFIFKDKHNLLTLNYKQKHAELAYIESIRAADFLNKNKSFSLFVKDVIEKTNIMFFIFLVFGSSAKNKHKPRDIDILFVIEDKARIASLERFLNNTASNFSQKLDINVISVESVYEMLRKRNEHNVINESLNNHIIICGAEQYFRLLQYAG